MYQITVLPLFLSGKDTFRQTVPMLSWMILVFTTFILMCVFDLYILVIPFLFEFISVIPVGIWSTKRSKKIREKSCKPIIIPITVQNGKMYKDNIKLNLPYSPSKNIFYIDDGCKTGKLKLYHCSFSAIVAESEIYDFTHFCLRNNVQFKILL